MVLDLNCGESSLREGTGRGERYVGRKMNKDCGCFVSASESLPRNDWEIGAKKRPFKSPTSAKLHL